MRESKVIIDRASLAHNARVIKDNLPDGCRLMGVVKDNAYGHGSVETARVALENGVDWLAVAITQEGAVLRENGIAAPILVLGASPLSSVDAILRWDLRCGLFDERLLISLQKAASQKKSKVKVHLKIDTGMRRLGVADEAELRALMEVWKRCPNVQLEGVFTHFANSDDSDKSFCMEQKRRFDRLLEVIYSYGHKNIIIHAANTAATLNYPDCAYNMVRCGLGLYGHYPSRTTNKSAGLKPVLSWVSEISRVCWIKKGESVGYGRAYFADSDRLIATIPVGYGDGYKRILGGRAAVLVRGQRAPVIGRICMDQFMIDVTEVTGEIEAGEPVVLIGSQQKESISADDMAAWADTISYEIFTSIGNRISREYR